MRTLSYCCVIDLSWYRAELELLCEFLGETDIWFDLVKTMGLNCLDYDVPGCLLYMGRFLC